MRWLISQNITEEELKKYFFIARDPKDLVELEDYLRTHFGDKTTIVYSAVTCLEVMNKNVSKGDALAHLLEIEIMD